MAAIIVSRASPLAALVAATLTACGGGGGGGNNNGGSSQPPPPTVVPLPPPPMPAVNAPPFPALDLTAATAPDAFSTAQRVLEEGPPLATFAVFLTDLLMHTGPTSFGQCPTLPLVSTPTPTTVHFDLDADGTVSRGDILQIEMIPCTGDTATMVFRPTRIDTVAQRLEGRVEVTTRSASSNSLEGSFDLVSTFHSSTERFQTLANLSFVLRTNGQADYVTGARIEVGAAGPAFQGYSFSFEANVASERLGRSYRVATPVPLRGNRGKVPSEGEIVVESLPARARIMPATDPVDREDLTDLAVDLTGSGQYGAATPLPWARLLRRENWFGWFPNTRPRITRLEITPANPNRLDTLVPSYDAFDYDGDPLQFAARWTRNGFTFPQFSPTLPPGNFVRGDVIELMLQAQDPASGVDRRSITFTIANAPPSATAAITPTAPISAQDLALSSTSGDPDGDVLTTTYAWRIDGAILPNQNSPSLSHTLHAKNDVVAGIAIVSDGFTTTTAEASVTILDTPGDVAVPSPPVAVSHDDSVSFTAVASDYDGDDTSTKDFRIVYGPAGMTVHPDTGLVSWLARGPMFERTLRVNYGISIDEPGAGVATGSFVLSDPNRAPPLARGAIVWPMYGGLRVGDFDDDGDVEIFAAGDSGVNEIEKAPGPGYRQAWADFLSFGNVERPTAVAAGDVDGDGRAELFVAHGSTVLRYSGTDRAITYKIELAVPQDYMCGQLELADLDRDGDSELVCLATHFTDANVTATGVIVVLAADTLDVIKEYPLGAYRGFIAVGNVDNDAAFELVTAAGHVFDGVTALSASFATQWPNAPAFGWTIETGDVDGDGVAEIVALDRDGNAVKVFDARTRTQRWSIATADPVALHVADVTGDATAEVLVGNDFTGRVTAFRQDPAATTTSTVFSFEFGDNAGVDAIATGDLDDDGSIEVIASGQSSAWFGIAGRNPASEIEWRFGGESALEAGFGFTGGELLGADLVFMAVAAGTESQRFTRFDTTDGSIALSDEVIEYGGLDAAFAITDYDDDGVREALLATEDNVSTRVLAYDFATGTVEWSSVGAVGEEGPADVAYADFTGDGRDELVVLTETGAMRVYNLVANTLLYERTSTAVPSANDVAIANLDGTGLPEIVATIDDRVVAFSRTATGFEVTATSARFVGIGAMEVTDIDGDGAIDIFVLHGDSSQTAQVARLDRFLLLRGEATLGQWAIDLTTERSSFARKNLVFWNSDFTSDLFVADPTTGDEVWRAPKLIGHIPPDSVRYHDLAGNGDVSISVGAGGITLTR